MSQQMDVGGPVRVEDRSTAELVQQASEQITRLVKDELALARSELASKGRHAGAGAGLLGGGGLIALYGLGALIVAAGLGLAVVMPGWLAALIVGGVLLVIAGLMALVGREQVRQAVPPVPQEAAHSIRTDLESVGAAMRYRGRP
jgi:hypothetical protein